MLAFGIGQLAAGPVSDRVGRMPVLMAGIVAFGLASMAALLAADIETLLALRVAQGAGAACAVVAGRALVRDHFEAAAAAPLLAHVFALTALVSVVAPVLGGYLEQAVGYRGSFAVMAAFALAVLVLLASGPRAPARTPATLHPRALLRGMVTIVRDDAFRLYTALGCASFGGLFAFLAASPRVMIDGFGMAPEHYGYVYSVAVIGLLAGNLLCRRGLARHGLVGMVRRAAFLSLVAGVLVLVAVALQPRSMLAVTAPFCLYMLAHGMLMPCVYAGVAARVPDRAGMANAMLGALQMALAFGVGQWLEASYDGTAWPIAWAIAVAAVVVFALGTWLVPARRAAL
jgi:DHA1 family bicyclomycin/chloramphenicol resistance-like MFS transporter